MKKNRPENKGKSPFSIPNIKLFIAFRLLYNSRFYYPVFTILFLDFGLTVAQFSILNAVWAATIVLAEVPSGALADTVGRRTLLIFSAVIMIIEIGMISFLPVGNPTLVFSVFLLNRVLSGLAQASASGADEAIAYDSLKEKGDPGDWGRVLEVLPRFQSLGFIFAMTLGAAVYDPELVKMFCGFLGFHVDISQQVTMKFPLYLTFVSSLVLLWVALRMKETGSGDTETGSSQIPREKAKESRDENRREKIGKALRTTLAAGGWILKTPFVFSVILFGLLFDGLIRMVITLASQYYRVIEIPESMFGIIGSLVSMLGFVVPKMARGIAENRPPEAGLWVAFFLTVTGLAGMSMFWPVAGFIPALITFSAMYFNGFFVSFYINRETSSEKRATVLSFKGLAYNLSYGVLGVMYSILLKVKKGAVGTGEALENQVFMETFKWFPGTFIAGFLLALAIYFLWIRKSSVR